jgi:hypothetical protein
MNGATCKNDTVLGQLRCSKKATAMASFDAERLSYDGSAGRFGSLRICLRRVAIGRYTAPDIHRDIPASGTETRL